MQPGEYLLAEAGGDIEINAGRKTTRLLVKNLGDRPVQVGSHYHFYEINKVLEFERQQAYGMRLNIASGTAVRFEPGEEKEVILVEFGGARIVYGHQGQVNGPLDLGKKS
ncbi:urease subunit beta [Dictyobacter sp. S3.2.2.5]|uniref:Urease subunit beta n=1 Tax=Dictyobacter halimunensis TaxID=3026934 RepID=A0ABQ6FLY7_9CHLR|nr:urease subunit beta [Dictyobacter sp. S3.2.2.5]